MKLDDLAVDHDYYASSVNYYSNDAGDDFRTWADFYEEFHDADIDMNLVYRWDIHKREESGRYRMEIFIIHGEINLNVYVIKKIVHGGYPENKNVVLEILSRSNKMKCPNAIKGVK